MVYQIDDSRFSTLEEFFTEFYRTVPPRRNPPFPSLDGFNDVLRGGFGTPEEGFTIRWKNHELSRERLGYPETVRQLEQRLLNVIEIYHQLTSQNAVRGSALPKVP